MKKLIRLSKEFFFVLCSFKNPATYFRERLGRSPESEVIVRMRNGISYKLHAKTNEIRMVNEIWNESVYDRLLSYVKDGATVIDIGANIGVFSVKAGKAAKRVRVVSYEPFPQSFAALKENIALNGLQNLVFPVNKAVAGERSERELFYRENDPGGVSLQKYGDKSQLDSVRVGAVTLQDVFTDNKIERCDYMKVDCEGAEEEIFLNVPKELFQKIRSMTFEWHADLNKLSVEEFCNFLKEVGYDTNYVPRTQTLYAWRP